MSNNNTVPVPICGRCKLAIVDVCFARIQSSLVMQKYIGKEPQIFYSPESAENYAQHIDMHADCWIDTLRDHGANLHNMTEVFNKMREEAAKGKVSNKKPPKKKRGK